MVEVKGPEVLKVDEVMSILGNLSLRWVTTGDYIVAMNSQVDATIGGEPYLALQLWLNAKSGKIIRRIWDQTVAFEKVSNGKEFKEACMSHFNGRPCIGNLTHVDVNKEKWHNFVISHTPIPRKISRSCQKLLDRTTDISIKSCPHCLNLGDTESQPEDMDACNNTEKLFKDGGQIEDMEENTHEDEFRYSSNINGGSFDVGNNKPYSQNEKQGETTFEEENMQMLVVKNSSSPTPNTGKGSNGQAIWLSYEKRKSYMKKECEHCRKKIDVGFFSRHMLQIHGIEGKFYKQCNWCKKKLSATCNYLRHAKKNHFYGRFLCEKCAFIGCFAKEVIEHCKEEHGEHNTAKCPLCNNAQRLNDLEDHYKSCISKKYQNQIDNSDRMCATCGKILKSQKALSGHIKSHLREEHANAEVSTSPSLQNDDLYHYCDQCDMKFVSLVYLNHHVKSEHENFEYKCSLCPMTFKTKYKSDEHKRIVHLTDEKYQCKFCSKRFGSVDRRESHERVHKEPEFQCRLCPKRLKSPLSLKAHERQHTGERPFKCPICEAGFVSLGSLGQHTRGAHKIVGPRGGKSGWKTTTRENVTENTNIK